MKNKDETQPICDAYRYIDTKDYHYNITENTPHPT